MVVSFGPVPGGRAPLCKLLNESPENDCPVSREFITMESGAEQCAPLVLGHSARGLVARRSLDLEKMTVHWKEMEISSTTNDVSLFV